MDPTTATRSTLDIETGFWRRHSLSLAAGAVLALWILLYSLSRPKTHLGSFFGNAIADWSGVVVTVLATKFLYEQGSRESRRPPATPGWAHRLQAHSLTIFLIMTGIAWTILYARLDSEGKWGQVVGNVVSEWTQILALVLMTKRLHEEHSKEDEDADNKPRHKTAQATARRRR